MGMEETEEIDLFKVLSHPLRRRLLIYIAEKGAASYSDLIKIAHRPGALYHHLRLLGDLIYQDENRLYRLTPKGQRVYEFLASDFFIPEDTSIHKFLTPRFLFERIEGKIALCLCLCFLLSNIVWVESSELLPIFILVAPINHGKIFGPILAILNWLISGLLLVAIIRLLNRRHISYFDVLSRQTLAFLLVNMYPLFIMGQSFLIICIIYVLVQFFSLLFSISAVSVSARLSLRNSLVTVLIVHYLALIVVIAAVILGPISISITP